MTFIHYIPLLIIVALTSCSKQRTIEGSIKESKEKVKEDADLERSHHQSFNQLGQFRIGEEKLSITKSDNKIKAILTRGNQYAGPTFSNTSGDWFVYVFEGGDMWIYNEGRYTVYQLEIGKATAIGEEYFQSKNITIPAEVLNQEKANKTQQTDS